MSRFLLLISLVLLLLSSPLMAADTTVGSRLYMRHCQNCHGTNGQPLMPAMPDFSRGERLLRADEQVVSSIEQGQGMMPAFAGRFSRDELYALVAFLRTLR